jgi:tRNA-binding EMAP/Myf-like protein
MGSDFALGGVFLPEDGSQRPEEAIPGVPVDAGEFGELQIITAATNIFVGAVVPVALDGSTLANGDKIFNGQLRGLPSYGMFCSGEELGITDD